MPVVELPEVAMLPHTVLLKKSISCRLDRLQHTGSQHVLSSHGGGAPLCMQTRLTARLQDAERLGGTLSLQQALGM